MRYAASEKLEIIRLVEGSHLPVKHTLEKLGVSRPTYYRWYDRHLQRGESGLEDLKSHPGRVWNRIPDKVRQAMLDMALARPELSPRELAVTFTDERSYFVSEASVYRLLRSHDLITSPAFIVMKAASEFRDKTTAPNQLWQTDFTYLKVIGWGWFYLSTILDDYSRYIITWKLCTGMAAFRRAGHVKPSVGRNRSGSSNCRASSPSAVRQWSMLYLRRSGRVSGKQRHDAHTRCALSSANTGQD